MNGETNQKQKTGICAKLALACAAIGLVLVLAMTFLAVREAGGAYRALRDADLESGFRGTLSYNDRLYAQLGYGIEIGKDDADKDAQRSVFLEETLRHIDARICAAGLIYTMMIAVVLALYLTARCGARPRKHLLAIALATVAIYLVFLAAAAGLFALYGARFYLPHGLSLGLLGVGLASIIGGCCALGLVLRSVRYPAIAAVVAVPLAAILIISGMLIEAGLYAVPTLDTFDYVYALYPPEETDEMYYDDAQNVMVVGDETCPPEPAPNQTRYTGVAAVAGAVYEAVNPFSGNSLETVRQFEDETIPGWVLPLYLLKAALWAVLLAVLPVKKPKQEPEEEESSAA